MNNKMEDCKIKASHPLFTQSNEDWVMWAILHACGRSETIMIQRGSKAPRGTLCSKDIVSIIQTENLDDFPCDLEKNYEIKAIMES